MGVRRLLEKIEALTKPSQTFEEKLTRAKNLTKAEEKVVGDNGENEPQKAKKDKQKVDKKDKPSNK